MLTSIQVYLVIDIRILKLVNGVSPHIWWLICYPFSKMLFGICYLCTMWFYVNISGCFFMVVLHKWITTSTRVKTNFCGQICSKLLIYNKLITNHSVLFAYTNNQIGNQIYFIGNKPSCYINLLSNLLVRKYYR